jgi:hypothetical protein
MKKNVSISIDCEKLSALEMYLGQKNLNLSDELDKCIESLYQKNVPQNVRDFLKMKESAKPSRKTKILLLWNQNINRRSNSPRVARQCLV